MQRDWLGSKYSGPGKRWLWLRWELGRWSEIEILKIYLDCRLSRAWWLNRWGWWGRERCHWWFPGCYCRELRGKVMSLYWIGQLGGGSLGRGAEGREISTPSWTFSVWGGIRHTSGDDMKVFGYIGLELRRMIWGWWCKHGSLST